MEKPTRYLNELCLQQQVEWHAHGCAAVAGLLAKESVLHHFEVDVVVLHYQQRYLDLTIEYGSCKIATSCSRFSIAKIHKRENSWSETCSSNALLDEIKKAISLLNCRRNLPTPCFPNLLIFAPIIRISYPYFYTIWGVRVKASG